MPVNNTSALAGPFTPNGSTTVFPFAFNAPLASDVKVYDGSGNLVSSALYTVALYEGDGGTVTFGTAPTAIAYPQLFIALVPSFAQTADFTNTGPTYNPAQLTAALDAISSRIIALKGEAERALKLPLGETAAALPPVADLEGKFLAVAGAKIVGLEADIPEAASQAAAAQTAREGAEAAQEAAEQEAEDAQESAEAAEASRVAAFAAAVASQGYFPAARSHVPRGAVVGAATIGTAGSGGTNGTFSLAFSGGNFAVNPTGTFTVSGGAVTAINITGAGLYIGGAISAPTLSFAASSGLTGAAGTYNAAFLKTAGQYWLTDTSPASNYLALFQNQANAAVEIDPQFDPMSAGASQAWAEGTLPGGAGTKSAKEHALDAAASAATATTERQRAQFAAGFDLRADLLAAEGAANGYTSIARNDAATHIAVSGEIALGGGAASVGASIPNEGTYTRTGGAWLRTGDTPAQLAAAEVDRAEAAAAEADTSKDGAANAAASQIAALITWLGNPALVVSQIVAQHGVTFNFSQPRPAGQYANGDWWVLGPVSITSITPASFVQTSGLNGDGSSYTNRTVHGTMVNPGNRSFATGGLTANNTTNTVQGWDSIGSSKPRVAYSSGANVDPGATGVPLDVTTGSVVKFVSKLTSLPNGAENRPAGLDIVVLTVVNEIPAADAIRPGVSRAGNKASPCRLSDFNLGVFQNLAPTANAPTYATALDWIDRYHETSQPDSINNPVAKGINNHPEYGRDIGNNLHRAMLCLHLSSFTSDQKRTLLAHLAAIADDLVSRNEEGAVVVGGGGGNQWKKPVIALCAAALGAKAPASWLTWLSFANRNTWGEDSQIFAVGSNDVATPRFTGDGRPRSAYTRQMLGSFEWGEAASYQPERSGSNWDAFYRDIVAYSLYPGVLAVELTTGAKALWDHPGLWLYMDTVFLRRTEGGAGNTLLAFPLEMANAYRPAKTAVPAIVETGIKDADIWVRFDQALNETATLPPLADFTVNVNGSPVTISSRTIWRQNLGLTLAAAVSGNDTVTMSYTGTTNRVRSVDGVNIADISARALTNRTDKVGGPNAAFPVVRFVPGVVRTLGGTNRLHDANTQVCTGALLKFKFDAAPAAESRFFGAAGGAISLMMVLGTDRRLDIRLQNSSASIICRFVTPALTAGVEYDILFSVDMTQATGAAAVKCYINGTLQTLTIAGYTSGGTIGWNVSNALRWNHTGNLNFEFGAFWLDPTTLFDLTSSGNRAKFTSLTSGNLDILTRGDGITGSIPRHFHVGNADQWNDGGGINRGTGDKFFVTSGLVSLVSGGEWI